MFSVLAAVMTLKEWHMFSYQNPIKSELTIKPSHTDILGFVILLLLPPLHQWPIHTLVALRNAFSVISSWRLYS